MKKVLVTGALGQIGSELVRELAKRYGKENIISSDIRDDLYEKVRPYSTFAIADATNALEVERLIAKYRPDTVYHLAAILSASAEERPLMAWEINMNSLVNVLESSRVHGCSVFVPSSIGAFGPTTPKENTPQVTIQRPTSIYGVTKVAGELLCDYYHYRFGIDTRGVRFPGLISNDTLPGGGTTDYAVDIYYSAIKEGKYSSFLSADTRLDMMYMPDAINAMIKIMEADPSKMKNRNAYNITAMSITPEDIAASIKKFMPEFELTYHEDHMRQAIADSWPDSIDASAAKEEWGFSPEYDLDAMTKDMLDTISKKQK
ncbi:nucleoside-diphosphate-sugar epimerase [Balneicella halophila]|uniref:Nucleoside-diphosphate-sugar epimerase n=1 Tax=Balneicella halophila TaxID=1537566 RepID=A0A7L4UR19_BALHA|nr:NAD-dependent epimerase/dehydratase family protein [Balneicella halophila]PVX51891.1 nucleoside-diphosphate-sugar epimerase [Balneicella halophila]